MATNHWENWGYDAYAQALGQPSYAPRPIRTPIPRPEQMRQAYNQGGVGTTGAKYQGRRVPGGTNKGRSYGTAYGMTSSKGGKNVSQYRYRTQDDPSKRGKFDMSPSSGRLYGEDWGRTQQKIRDMKDRTTAQSNAARGGGGGGSSRGRGGQSSTGGKTKVQRLASSYASAAGAANRANESRYQDILGQYNAALGGGRGRVSGGGGGGGGGMMTPVGTYDDWQRSGSTLPYMQWKRLMQAMEIRATQTGGQFGSMDASGLYPRQYGSGDFLGQPGAGTQSVSGVNAPAPIAPMPRPAAPVYTPPPAYQMPVRETPSYAVGTPYVPRTGQALVHEGERITPAIQNPAARVTPMGPKPAPGVTPGAPLSPMGKTGPFIPDITSGMSSSIPTSSIPQKTTGNNVFQRPSNTGISSVPTGGASGGSRVGGVGLGTHGTPVPPTSGNKAQTDSLGYKSRQYYDEQRSKLSDTYGERSDALQKSYEQRQKALNKQLTGYGNQQLADQSQRANNLQSSIQQDMVSRGLTGSTVMPSMQMAGARESNAERARINENLQAMKTGLAERASADTLGYRRGNESERLGLGQSNIRDSYGNYTEDRAFGEGQFQSDRNFGRGVYEDDRNFGRGAFEADRSFGQGQLESDRQYGLQAHQLNRQDFNSDREFQMAQKQQDFQNFMQRLSREDQMLLAKLGFMERRTDAPPDINQMIQALQQYGQYGG